jgi:hypothetical protein
MKKANGITVEYGTVVLRIAFESSNWKVSARLQTELINGSDLTIESNDDISHFF